MNWKEKNINLGVVLDGSTHVIKFELEGEIDKEFLRLTPSCGCTKPKWIPEEKAVVVTFKPKAAKHLKVTQSNQSVYIEYTDSTSEILEFNAKIENKNVL
jgi:hypothetical protein